MAVILEKTIESKKGISRTTIILAILGAIILIGSIFAFVLVFQTSSALVNQEDCYKKHYDSISKLGTAIENVSYGIQPTATVNFEIPDCGKGPIIAISGTEYPAVKIKKIDDPATCRKYYKTSDSCHLIVYTSPQGKMVDYLVISPLTTFGGAGCESKDGYALMDLMEVSNSNERGIPSGSYYFTKVVGSEPPVICAYLKNSS